MNIKERIVQFPNRKKATKLDSNYNIIEKYYLDLESFEGNVTEKGTAINKELLEQINWKDNEQITFKVLSSDKEYPEISGTNTVIYTKSNGETWVIPAGRIENRFKLEKAIERIENSNVKKYSMKTSGWKRIASFTTTFNYATFTVANHFNYNINSAVAFTLSGSWTSIPAEVVQIGGTNIVFSKVRVLQDYHSSNGFIEIYYEPEQENIVHINMSNAGDLTLIETETAGYLPIDFLSTEFIFNNGFKSNNLEQLEQRIAALESKI